MKALLLFAKSFSLTFFNQPLLHAEEVKEYGDHVTIGFYPMVIQKVIAEKNVIIATQAFIVILNFLNLKILAE